MKLSRRDKVVTVILVVIILILIYIMQCHWRNRFGDRGEAKPVGTVEYKYHQVQRKYSDRMLWEDVETKSAIYAYDWVMTKDKSDARITLNNGMKVDMDPESMVEIDETRDGVGLTLRDGTIRADTRGSKNGSITAADGTKIDLSGADAQITTDGKNVSVDVKEGNATLKSHDKESKVGAGEIGNLSSSGFTKEKTSIVLKSPAVGAVQESAATPVQFAFDAPPGSEDCKISLSGNKTKRLLAVKGGARSEKLGDGTYKWRVTCSLKGQTVSSPTGTFRVRPGQNFALLSPAPGQVVYANQTEGLALRWRSNGPVKAELSRSADFSAPVKTADTSGQSLAVPNLKPGKYYWRVSPAGDKNQALSSSFTVSDKGELLAQSDEKNGKKPKTDKNEKPENLRITARSESKFIIEPDAKTAPVRIAWTPVNKKMQYRVRISESKDFSEELASRDVSGKGQATLPLGPGTYYYRVDMRKAAGTRPLASTIPQKITVTQKKLPPPPRVKSVQAE
ncbi:MAG: FecR domain-containing protein [Spirochaetes bacterium]|nr:FecR domain-containing protein [Spirochaetota bacterium]